MNTQQPVIDPTEVRYHLKCKIVTKQFSAQQGVTGGASEYTGVALIPDKLEDQTRLFFNAWLSDSLSENVEVMLEFPHPIFGRGRCFVIRYTPIIKEPHIMISNVSIEEILKKMVGKTIRVTVLKGTEECEVDQDDLSDKASL